MTTLKTTPIGMNCSGCGAEGQGAMRQYLGNPRNGKRPVKHFNDHPDGWGIRFVGKVRLDFCGKCRSGLAEGTLRLVGTTVVVLES